MSLPPLPSPPQTLENWETGALQLIYAGQQALFEQGVLLMATVAELQAAIDRNTAATNAAVAAMGANAPTQAQIDQINANSAALEGAVMPPPTP